MKGPIRALRAYSTVKERGRETGADYRTGSAGKMLPYYLFGCTDGDYVPSAPLI